MRKFYFLFFILFETCGFSQDLTCKDFKNGKFYIPIENNAVDTLFIYNRNTKELYKHKIKNENDLSEYLLIRENDKQIEWENGENIGNPTLANIFWTDECSYKLVPTEINIPIPENTEADIFGEEVKVIIENIKDNCAQYKALLELNNNIEIYQIGVLCKSKED